MSISSKPSFFYVSGIVDADAKILTVYFGKDIFRVPITPEMPNWLLNDYVFFRAEASADALRERNGANLNLRNFQPLDEYQDWAEEHLQKVVTDEF